VRRCRVAQMGVGAENAQNEREDEREDDEERGFAVQQTRRGRSLSDAHRKRISEAMRRYFRESPQSDETRKRQSRAKTGSGNPMYQRKHSAATLALMSNRATGAKNANYRRQLSEETKRRISESMKLRWAKRRAATESNSSEDSESEETISSRLRALRVARYSGITRSSSVQDNTLTGENDAESSAEPKRASEAPSTTCTLDHQRRNATQSKSLPERRAKSHHRKDQVCFARERVTR